MTYYISPTRAAFVQKGNLNNFSVNYQGVAVTGDLSSAEIQIWNQGKAPIHKSDILKRITLSTPNGEPFYTEIYSNTRNDIVGFELLYTNKLGVLPMEWKILEKGDAIKLQVIYGGSVTLPLALDGAIENQQWGITKYKRNTSEPSNEDLIVIILIIVLVSIFFAGHLRRDSTIEFYKQAGKWKILPLLALGLWLAFLCYVVIYLLLHSPTLIMPPFGL